ncbi:carbohydrate ABC transporter permease [Nitriliruptor alkaliphilus]|uniref:carbohydrate ABC transporter permease n=1 Tax=Nitriliruptor alkaliphilus TaxID=427918 RepID=UPI000ADE6BAB|nr:sugar ABC transporter permease [Nitriliruptor alkaliphilus]
MSATPTPPFVPPDTVPPGGPPDAPERPATKKAPTAPVAVSLVVLLVVFLGAISGVARLFVWLDGLGLNRLLVVIAAIAIGVVGVFVLFRVLDLAVNQFPKDWRESVRPWVFVGPALVLLSIFLLYPAVNTVVVSFQDATATDWVGFDNYQFVFSDPAMLRSIRNTLAWMVIVPAFGVVIGLVFAVLADRLPRGESLAKSLIFLPMAVSFVGASVVWAFIYDHRPFGNQTGLLNGLLVGLGQDPVSWQAITPWNNLFLMVIMIWTQTGFAMVILSAAIKSVPDDMLEAARIDGATELQVFRRIIVPSIMSAIVVVATTMVVNVLKVFDIVYVMGWPNSEVIAERMYRWSFAFRNTGRGAAVAVLLFLAVVPVLIVNIKRFRAEEEIR